MAEQRAENPIKKIPNPNIFLSKAEFIEMRAKERALKVKMEAYEKKAKAEIEAEDNVEEEQTNDAGVQTVVTVKKKGGRPKKAVETV